MEQEREERRVNDEMRERAAHGACPSHSQNNGHGCEEHSSGCVLLSVVNLLPVGEPSGISLVSGGVGGALQVVEHDVHAL